MSHYGISAIHWNSALADVDEVRLHKFVRQGSDGSVALKHGRPAWCTDVAKLIRNGHTVWVMVSDGRGSYLNTDRVRVRVNFAQRDRLYSCSKNGTPNAALIELPRYSVLDDPPSRPQSSLPASVA